MTKTDRQYFTDREIAEDIKNTLENGYNGYYSELHNEVFNTGYYSELHNEVFNTGYYIVGAFEAKQALEQYGTFSAIEEIRDYEVDNFGDFNTEIQPKKMANMLYYIKSENFLYNTFEFNCVLDEAIEDLELDETDLWNSEATEQVNNYIIKKLNDYLN